MSSAWHKITIHESREYRACVPILETKGLGDGACDPDRAIERKIHQRGIFRMVRPRECNITKRIAAQQQSLIIIGQPSSI